ncbi:MAG TPA: hypothetical protein VFD58_01605 [Blastocatellia bacterium]|nr:hypothetical protein [Blastocatellia bacterium]
MKRLTNFLNGALLVLSAVNAMARTGPDFSGRWAVEPDTPRAAGSARAGNMGSGWGSNITIAQTAERLTVTYEFFARGDRQPPLKFVYALDGSETKNSVMMGRGIQAQTSKTAWESDKLVITTTHSFDNPATGQPLKVEVKQTLALTSPTTLAVETTRSGVSGGPPSTTRIVYQKSWSGTMK